MFSRSRNPIQAFCCCFFVLSVASFFPFLEPIFGWQQTSKSGFFSNWKKYRDQIKNRGRIRESDYFVPIGLPIQIFHVFVVAPHQVAKSHVIYLNYERENEKIKPENHILFFKEFVCKWWWKIGVITYVYCLIHKYIQKYYTVKDFLNYPTRVTHSNWSMTIFLKNCTALCFCRKYLL